MILFHLLRFVHEIPVTHKIYKSNAPFDINALIYLMIDTW